jgi:hypothetical protein
MRERRCRFEIVCELGDSDEQRKFNQVEITCEVKNLGKMRDRVGIVCEQGEASREITFISCVSNYGGEIEMSRGLEIAHGQSDLI